MIGRSKVKEKLEREQKKMRKSLTEGQKYFVQDQKFVPKGWGYELWIWNTELYCGKKLFFKKGKKCSWHYHEKKDEVFYCEHGKFQIFFSEDDDLEESCGIILNPGDAFHVPPGLRHRMVGLLDSMLTEISTQHFDEDSIVVEKGDKI